MGDSRIDDDRQTLATVADRSLGDADRGEALQRGAVAGRYVVLSQLGAGGMGIVYAAYDPELDRKVALKLLHASASDEDGARLLGEARAMAKLSHPNVITVHDVGTIASRVYIAMEFVAGQTLRAWANGPRRSWRDVLAVYLLAGRGLAAAHGVGLVHRDFKPDNVMIGDEGRVRVMDFGLALATVESAEPEIRAHRRTTADAGVSTSLGSVVGTPAYMSPEQHLGLAADARTDQFSFCVALWEGLHGARPYHASTLAALVLAVTEGRRRPPPADARVPGWLRRVLERGLAPDPAARYPDLEALLAALARDPTRARRRALVLVGGATIVAGAIAWQRLDHAGKLAACDREAAAIDEVWNDDVAAAIQGSFAQSGVPLADDAWARAAPQLDAYAQAWAQERRASCIAREVERTRSPELSERSQECLEDGMQRFAALVDVLGEPDEETVHRSVRTAATLHAPAPCNDDVALARRHGSPAREIREQVATIAAQLQHARALESAGRYAPALASAQAAEADAAALGWLPLHAQALVVRGRLRIHAGAYAEGSEDLREAYLLAGRARSSEIQADAGQLAVLNCAEHLAEPDQARFWGDLVEMVMDANDEPQGTLARATLANVRGIAELRAGDAAKAVAHLREALAMREAVLGPDHLDVGLCLNNLGIALRAAGELDESLAMCQRSQDIAERVLGPDHPDVATIAANVAIGFSMRQDLAPALLAFERALAIRESALGADHPLTGEALNNLGAAQVQAGDLAAARRSLERALAIRERTLGPDNPVLAETLTNLGALADEEGRFADALQLKARALEIRERAQGRDHPEVVDAWLVVGYAHAELGHAQQARELFARALASREASGDEASIAAALLALANAEWDLEDYAAGEAHIRRALALIEGAPQRDDPALVDALDSLGHMVATRGRREEALAIYRRAVAHADETLPAGDVRIVWPLLGVGEVLIELGRAAEAVAVLERATAARATTAAGRTVVARTRLTLATALWEVGEQNRAIDEATAAVEELEQIGRRTPADEGRKWLQAHVSRRRARAR